ncbi:MAG: hypothetical protein IJX28_00905 [Clostridia bacterium]|nr:hypothetical protein [Clostridia bacterium]
MRKSLKSVVELPVLEEPHCLLDMNHYERLEAAGLSPDLKHNRSAHMTAAWRPAERERVAIPMGGVNLSKYRYLTFAVFSVQGAGCSFALQLESGEEGTEGYAFTETLSLTRDGWNEFRVELPFMETLGEGKGRDSIQRLCLQVTAGKHLWRAQTVLYFDNLFLWDTPAPALYCRMPELKGAAAFAKSGGFAIVDRKRVQNSIESANARPLEREGGLWLPMGSVAAGLAHSAVADTLAMTLSFTYRRKKYVFSANADYVLVNGERESLGFTPIPSEGALFFPLEYVRTFFHWRQCYLDPMGLIVLSNRKSLFDPARDEETVLRLIGDMTFHRPTGEAVLSELRRRFPNPLRGRLFAGHDQLVRLRKLTKTEGQLREYLDALKLEYGKRSEVFASAPVAAAAVEDPETACREIGARLWAFSTLYRLSGEKEYGLRAWSEAECLCDSTLGEQIAHTSLPAWSTLMLGLALCYDWCHHSWSEAQKAKTERTMLRYGMRVGIDLYEGKRSMWRKGSPEGAAVNAAMLSLALSLSEVYPESALKLLNSMLPNVEACFSSLVPDGGCAQSPAAWEQSAGATALIVAMLREACGTDYGLSRMPGWRATAYFPIYMESAGGVWNYHGCANRPLDTSVLFLLARLTKDPHPAWLRRQQILSGKKPVHPLDLLYFCRVEDANVPHLPLDTVYRKAGLAVMRSGWDASANLLGLHGGCNRIWESMDLDAGGVLLEMEGERFFCETGGETALPSLLRARAEGQNTLVIDPTEEPAPDQNPGASAPLLEMRSDAQRAYAVVDMSATNDLLVRGKRGVLLTQNRSVAVVQDELVVSQPTVAVWSVWTRAEIKLNKSGRTAKLTQNGKTLLCKLGGVGYPARFEVQNFEDAGMARLFVRISVKERLRMFVACKLLEKGIPASEKVYENTPMSNWGK